MKKIAAVLILVITIWLLWVMLAAVNNIPIYVGLIVPEAIFAVLLAVWAIIQSIKQCIKDSDLETDR